MAALPFNRDRTIGAAFLGNVTAGIFYGITSVQTFIYFKSNFNDHSLFRLLILGLWLLDSLHIALTTHGMYFYLVTNFTNPLAISFPVWSLLCQVYITCVSDFAVRCVFAQRVWRLSKSVILFATIVIATFYVTASGMAFASRGFITGTFEQLMQASWLLYSALGSAVFADVFIAVSLCLLLRKHRTGFKETDSLVNVLMLYSINTGLLTSICATASFVTFAIWPDDFVFMGIYFTLSKLYLNSLLATLNARSAFRESEHQDTSQHVGLSFKFTPRDHRNATDMSEPNLHTWHTV